MAYSEIHDFSEVASEHFTFKDGNEIYDSLSTELQAKLNALPFDKALEIITAIIVDLDNRIGASFDIALDTTAEELLESATDTL